MNSFDLMLEQAKQPNKVIQFDGGYFSFAFGNEIALVFDDQNEFFILNCGSCLWKLVQEKVAEIKNKDELTKWWYKQSKESEISGWSDNFEHLLKEGV